MRASKGDTLRTHGRIVGQHDQDAEIVEVMGKDGNPPFRVRFQDGHESVMYPGPDSVVRPKSEHHLR